MYIFYATHPSPNVVIKSNLWKNNLYQSLVDLGHNVTEFKYDLQKTFQNLNPDDPIQKKFIQTNRPKVSKELLNQIKKINSKYPIDIFFSYFYDACVLPETIEKIKSLGIKTINWYCNGSYQLNLVSEISPHYDYCLVPEKFRLNDYKKMGANPIYCQEGANPNIYKPYNLPKEFDVTFVGQAYGERPDYIRYILNQNINIKVWGYGWNYYSEQTNKINKSLILKFLKKTKTLFSKDGLNAIKYKLNKALYFNKTQIPTTITSSAVLPNNIIGTTLSDLEMIKMYSRSKINIGFSSCGNTHKKKQRILQVRLRDFEVPMSGGFYMVEQMEELEEFFEIGKEIVCYQSKEDLADKIKFYLKHETEREKIRQAGYDRCLKYHTWHKRFNFILKNI